MTKRNFQSKEGQPVPRVVFKIKGEDEWNLRTTQQIFSGRTVIVFSLPGAFTPTCSSSHLPRYNALADTFKGEGVDEIICISVNDTFVMNAWAAQQQADKVTLIPDGNGDFTRSMGMLVDKTEIGFGERSWRYSMLVKDGIIDKMFIEEDVGGDPFEVSDADTMLNYINPEATLPLAVAMFTKPGCAFCAKAKALLTARGIAYQEMVLGEGTTAVAVQAVSGKDTFPQVYINGKHLGGSDELAAYFAD